MYATESQIHTYRGLIEAKKALLEVKGEPPASSGSFLADLFAGVIVAMIDGGFEARLSQGKVTEREMNHLIYDLKDEIKTLAAK